MGDDQLPWEEKLNYYYDFQANQVRSCEKCRKQRLKHNKLTPAPPYAATFQVGKIFVTTHLPLAIRNVAYRSEMEEYIFRKAGWASS